MYTEQLKSFENIDKTVCSSLLAIINFLLTFHLAN
ncbi:MAG: hypothetical protein RIT27_178 [Pseudomonadota bacterium]|jgi:hypothetical protein